MSVKLIDIDQLGATIEHRVGAMLRSGSPVDHETMIIFAMELDKALIGLISGDPDLALGALITIGVVASCLRRLDVKGQVIARV